PRPTPDPLRSQRPTPDPLSRSPRPTPDPLRSQRPTPDPLSRSQRPTPDPSRSQRPTPDPSARTSPPHPTTAPPILRRSGSGSLTIPPDGRSAAAAEIRRMIAEKMSALDRGADHYAILGVPQSAKADEIRTAYFAIAKRIHPDRLRAVGVTDVDHDA